MNYNNKPKQAPIKLSEKTHMTDQITPCLQPAHSGWALLRHSLLLAVLAVSTPALSLPPEGGTQATGTQTVGTGAAGTQAAGTGAISPPPLTPNDPKNSSSAVASPLSSDETKADQATSGPVPELQTPSSPSNTMIWIALVAMLLLLLGTIFIIYQTLQDKLEQLSKKVASLNNNVARLAPPKATSRTMQNQADPEAVSFSQRQGLSDRLDDLERRIEQLHPQRPSNAHTSGLDSRDDIPLLQSDLIVSPPLVSIDADDRQILQAAFLEWRANSRAKKLNDCLPNSFSQKIKLLGYDIVFAKAGLGLNRMIIDQKPPNHTCMIGLYSLSHSLMYCHEKTSQTDDLWRQNAWYEVSIDSPNNDGEQTVHQLKELQA